MPTLNINGQRVKVDDSFLSLSPDEQNAAVEEISGSLGSAAKPQQAPVDPQPSVPSPSGQTAGGDPMTDFFVRELGKATTPLPIGDELAAAGGVALGATDDIVRQLAKGATFGFADKIAGYLGGEGTEAERLRTEQAAQRLGPITSTAAQVVGSVAPVGRLAQGVAAGGQALSTLPLLGRVAASPTVQAAATGALSGVATGLGEDRGVGQEALLGAGAGVAGKLVGDAVSAGVGKVAGVFNKRPQIPAKDELKSAAQAAYQRADDAGLILRPEGVQRLNAEMQGMLGEGGYHPALQPKLKVAIDELGKLGEGNVTLKGVDVLRRIAGAAKADIDPSTRMFGGKFVEKLDDFIDNLRPGDILTSAGSKDKAVASLREARASWSSYRKAEMVDDAIANAVMNSSSAGSGGNLNNALRQQFKNILKNPKKIRSFTPDERAAMGKIVSGTPTANLARLIGKLSPQGNGLMLTVNLLTSAAAPSVGLPAAALGAGAKGYADRATQKGAEGLSELVRAGGRAEALRAPDNLLQRLAKSERQTLRNIITAAGVTLTPELAAAEE